MRREFREKEQPEFTMNKEKNERHRQREREGGEINVMFNRFIFLG